MGFSVIAYQLLPQQFHVPVIGGLRTQLGQQVPGETLRIYLRQELGNKLGILDDAQLERLMPKQGKIALNARRRS